MKNNHYIAPDVELAAVFCPGQICQASYGVATEVFEDPEEITGITWDD